MRQVYNGNCVPCGLFVGDHFDLDLQEAIEAPPLSLSTPDLHNIAAHYNPFQPLRRSASSSELLYEKVNDTNKNLKIIQLNYENALILSVSGYAKILSSC